MVPNAQYSALGSWRINSFRITEKEASGLHDEKE